MKVQTAGQSEGNHSHTALRLENTIQEEEGLGGINGNLDKAMVTNNKIPEENPAGQSEGQPSLLGVHCNQARPRLAKTVTIHKFTKESLPNVDI
jgi:hypothetical protein